MRLHSCTCLRSSRFPLRCSSGAARRTSHKPSPASRPSRTSNSWPSQRRASRCRLGTLLRVCNRTRRPSECSDRCRRSRCRLQHHRRPGRRGRSGPAHTCDRRDTRARNRLRSSRPCLHQASLGAGWTQNKRRPRIGKATPYAAKRSRFRARRAPWLPRAGDTPSAGPPKAVTVATHRRLCPQ